MKLSFGDNKLEKLANDYRKCQKEFGQKRGKNYENPIPTDKSGKYIWLEIKGVEILEIADYH